MLISRKRSTLPSTLPTLFIGSPEATMEKVICMKYLGVYISSDLSWSIHIDIITSKARRTFGFISTDSNVNSSVLTKLYTTLVRPLLEYCCAVWDPHLQKTLKNLNLYKGLHAKSVPRIGLHLTVTNFIFLTFLPLVIADYFSSSAQCTRFLTTPSPSQKTSSTSDQGSKPTLCQLAMCLQTHCILPTLTQTLL